MKSRQEHWRSSARGDGESNTVKKLIKERNARCACRIYDRKSKRWAAGMPVSVGMNAD